MESSEKLCWVYMTAGTFEEAKNIGQILVKKNLVACVNLIENMTSIYKWGDKLEEGQEVVLIAKTRRIVTGQCQCVKALPFYIRIL